MGQPCCKEGHGDITNADVKNIAKQFEQQSVHASPPPKQQAKPVPAAAAAPEVAPEPEPAINPGETIKILVNRSDEKSKWGLVWCENDSEPGMLRVKSVRPGNAFAAYNATAKPAETIDTGDRVVSVNGVKQSSLPPDETFAEMRKALHTTTSATIEVLKFPKNLTVTVDRKASEGLGLEVGTSSLNVQRVVLDCKLDNLNQLNRARKNFEQVVHEGMQILSANGEKETEKVRRVLDNELKVTLVLDRQHPVEAGA